MASAKQAYGIDVSHYKNQIDWHRVQASGVTFAILKATEGNNFIDSRFDYNWTRARRVGLIRGAYHFFRPLVDPVSQAHHFLRIVGNILDKTDLPPVLDVEVYPDFIKNEYKKISTSERQQRVKLWLQTVEAATGRTPIIYTDYYTWRDYLGNTPNLTRFPLWIAAYKVDRPKIPANNWGDKGWTFWQYTNKGVVPGIRDEAACVDLNHYISDVETLKGWLKITGSRPLPPPVSNGDMMAAIIDAAESLGASSDEWVARTKLRYLVDPIGNSLRPYDGPAIEELPLDGAEKAALANALDYLSVSFAALGITHQDLINAIYYAASLENVGGWSLVEKAGIEYIGEDRDQIYQGPPLEDLPGLTWNQKEAAAAYLGVDIMVQDQSEDTGEDQSPQETSTEAVSINPETPPTYTEDLTNQAVINAFHLMALELDANGQLLVASAGLEGLGEARNLPYTGPLIEELPGLTWDLKLHLAGLLNVPLVLPDDEIKVDSQQRPGPAAEPAPPVEPLPEPAAQIPAEDDLADTPVFEGDGEPSAVGSEVESDTSVPAIDPELAEQLPVADITGDHEPQPERAWMPVITNQDVIEAFFQAADSLGREGWSLLEQAGLLDLDINRAGRFAGLAAEKLERIGSDVTDLVVSALGFDNKKSLTANSTSAGTPYPGMVNLDMVNLFYKAASRFGENGQQWLDSSGMAYLNKNRASRFKPYHGPEVTELLKLNRDQRQALQAELDKVALQHSPGLD